MQGVIKLSHCEKIKSLLIEITSKTHKNPSQKLEQAEKFNSIFSFSLNRVQVEFIRRRQQHISTIDTSSPSRLLLASNASNGSSFVPINAASHIQIHKNNNPIGYCTLRNGSLHGHHQQQFSAMGGNDCGVSISPVPKQFQNPSNTCTLPRGFHNTNHWPTYGGTIAGTAVRNMSQTITISQSQHQPPPPPSCLAMSSLGANARPRVCIGLGLPPPMHSSSTEEDVETPLMLKRESSVIL